MTANLGPPFRGPALIIKHVFEPIATGLILGLLLYTPECHGWSWNSEIAVVIGGCSGIGKAVAVLDTQDALQHENPLALATSSAVHARHGGEEQRPHRDGGERRLVPNELGQCRLSSD
ncbi:hypothetical protein COCVIDRAFT_17323 [Bipolaris victoriae FI3]|uniref:Uncharacterized protein n=1 Tax=Bipolaris victoriae (strain FI3) TaxID=930091 RepID=W7EI51_BIPV3|nr:hypothetical protein COCVIDRAFT_17323 [Bipolaris victoriae FI3]